MLSESVLPTFASEHTAKARSGVSASAPHCLIDWASKEREGANEQHASFCPCRKPWMSLLRSFCLKSFNHIFDCAHLVSRAVSCAAAK